jgi:hypothetical protein
MVILEDQMLIWSGVRQDSYSQREPTHKHTHTQQQNIIIPCSRYALDPPPHHTKRREKKWLEDKAAARHTAVIDTYRG